MAFSRQVKYLIIYFWAICIVPNAHGAISQLVKCLANEEMSYHVSKKTGPNYQLNQYFINTLAGAIDINLRSEILPNVCNNPKFPPSVALLKELILNGSNIFHLQVEEFRIHAKQMNTVWTIEEELPNTFFNYLSSLQSTATDPHCLQKEIPSISYFLNRFKYLELDMGPRELLSPHDKLVKIFTSLERVEAILNKCQKSIAKKNKDSTVKTNK